MKRITLVFAAFFTLFLFSGCSRKNQFLEFDSVQVEAMIPGHEWILVTDPYVACHEQAGYDEKVCAQLRKGDICKVTGSSTIKVDDMLEKWYSTEDGWIPGRAVSIFPNLLRAQSAKNNLK